MFIGASAKTNSNAWGQVYRSLEHGFAKGQCMDQTRMRLFPQQVQDFANAFVTMQAKRHKADYDPLARFQKSAVRFDIDQIETAILDFCSVSATHRRAFAAYVLLKNRS